jgi:hypothetical protein
VEIEVEVEEKSYASGVKGEGRPPYSGHNNNGKRDFESPISASLIHIFPTSSSFFSSFDSTPRRPRQRSTSTRDSDLNLSQQALDLSATREPIHDEQSR